MHNPNEARVVRLTNIFDFDYTHAYGGVPYQLRAGETLLFPFAIGDHLATHLARQATIRKAPVRDENAPDGRGGESTRSDRPLWDDVALETLKGKIIQDAYVEERVAPLSEADRYKQKFEELNKQFPEVAQSFGKAPPPDEVTTSAIGEAHAYQDKAEVIAALTKQGIAHNPRAAKATLEKLLS